MNIVRALEVALPEMPERIVRQNPPKVDPRVISKQHIENGQPVVLVKMPGTDLVFRFSPLQWQLIQMFDGRSSWEEISLRFQRETGSSVSEEDIKELASFLQTKTPLLYKSALERNITLQEELRSFRKKRRSRTIDFAEITLKTWDNADGYISRLYPKVSFLFTPWFAWTSIGLFALMAWMWADRFGEIWSDSFAFYNFTQKSGTDLMEFWFLFGAMAAIHETAHGLAGKHYGATIEKMGFMLMYFAPSFFCDATQVWILGGRWARIVTAFAGIWLDLVVCFIATVVWWGTATGMAVHDWAYKVMMVTGIGVSILNLNPLIKLDGYLIFSELVAEPSLKESSTEYLSAWIRKHIFRLPAEVPYVPRRKRPFYAIYAVLSGMYSYVLLSFLMVITYHILRSFSPEWAFIPAALIGAWVFRSRIKLLVNFMQMLYLDKKQSLRAWLTPLRVAAVSAGLALVLFIPVWPDFVQGQFLLTPAHTAVLRATVPGIVTAVSVKEGERVVAGTPLVRLRNLELESRSAQVQERLREATAHATKAVLAYTNLASAEQERQQQVKDADLAREQLNQLAIVSPIPGTVLTPHVQDLLGRSLDEGDLVLQVADDSQLRAEIYLPEFAMHDVRVGQTVRLLLRGRLAPVSGVLSSILPTSVPIAEGMSSKEQLQGINPPRYFLGTVWLKNNEALFPASAGTAKVRVARSSLAALSLRFCRDLVDRRLW
ncbi:MAG TPA: HlyD family efflux transporter periplasmic adaptor subunit [Terriglobales bacterium]